MPLPFIVIALGKVVGAAGTLLGGYLVYRDYQISQDMADSVSQMEYYVGLINGMMGPEEFIAGAWPSLLAIFLILVAGYIIATPQRRKEGRT